MLHLWRGGGGVVRVCPPNSPLCDTFEVQTHQLIHHQLIHPLADTLIGQYSTGQCTHWPIPWWLISYSPSWTLVCLSSPSGHPFTWCSWSSSIYVSIPGPWSWPRLHVPIFWTPSLTTYIISDTVGTGLLSLISEDYHCVSVTSVQLQQILGGLISDSQCTLTGKNWPYIYCSCFKPAKWCLTKTLDRNYIIFEVCPDKYYQKVEGCEISTSNGRDFFSARRASCCIFLSNGHTS